MKALVPRTGRWLAELWSEPATRVVAILLCLVPALTLIMLAQLPRSGGRVPQLSSPPIEVAQTLSPTSLLFGDQLEARIDVLAGPTIDASSIRVQAGFRPYQVVSRQVERTRRESLSLVRTRFVLSCLTDACLPSRRASRQFRFPAPTISFREHARELRVSSPWSSGVTVSTRLGPPSARPQLVDRPPSLSTSFRISPGLLRVALACLAALLALAGALLVTRGLWPRFFYSRRHWRRLTPLQRALAQVEAAAAIEDEGTRRRTLDQLARRLREAELPALEREISSAAWDASPPRPESLELLVQRIRSDLDGGARR
jgi:hypothetical protein